MKPGVLNRYRSLHRKRLKEVGLVKIQGAVGRKKDNQFGELGPRLVAEREAKYRLGWKIAGRLAWRSAKRRLQRCGDFAVGLWKCCEKSPFEFQLAHHDLQGYAHHFVDLDRGVELAARFQQGLQAYYLLLGQKSFFTDFHRMFPLKGR